MKKVISFGLIILVALGIILLSIQTSYSYFEDNGYVIPDADIKETLSTRELGAADDISLIPTEENEEYKERLGSYYNEKNQAIDLDFPLIIKDGTALRFMHSGAYLINDSFEYSELVEKAIVSDQTYFGEDGQELDTGSYMMVQLDNKLFVSTSDMTIKNLLSTYDMNKNSVYYFDEEYINVYEYEKGKYSLVEIRGLYNATITVNGTEMSYADFYKKLLNVQELISDDKANQQEEADKAKDKIKNVKKEITSSGTPAKPADADAPKAAEEAPDVPEEPPAEVPDNPDPNPDENTYVKPSASITDISAWVYTINGQMTVKDPASRISGGVVFYVYNETGRLVLRQSVKKSGLLDLSILQPDTYYSVTAKFQYYDADDRLRTETVLEQTVVHTLPMEGNISPVALDFGVDEIALPNTMQINNSTLKNTTDYNPSDNSLANFYKNTLPYINRITLSFTGEDGKETTCNFPNSVLSNLKQGQTMNFETSKVLESSTQYSYKVTCYDKFGNVIEIDPEVSGDYKTSKTSPKVTASLTNATTTAVTLRMILKDVDQTLIGDGYTMKIYDGDTPLEFQYKYQGISGEGDSVDIAGSNTEVSMEITGLPYSTRLKAVFTADYDLQNGQGPFEDAIIGSLDFYSGGLPNGAIYYANHFNNIGGTFASMDLTIQRSSTTELVSLLTDLTFQINDDKKKFNQKITKEQFDGVDVEENYNEEKGYLMIQEGHAESGTPEIVLYATKSAILEQGAWQTFLNTGLIGENNALSGKVTVTYVPGTLTTNTEYKYQMASNININGEDHDITTNFTSDSFMTLANDVVVGYDDFFLAENFIEIYDISAIDVDSVIIGGTYYLQLLDGEEVIDSQKLKVGEDMDVVRFENLQVGHNYTLRFMAPEFNQGQDESTLEKNHVIEEYTFTAEEGVSASIELSSIQYSYESKDAENAHVSQIGEGISYGQTYDASLRTVVDDETRFITDYISYEAGKASVFQNFGAPEKELIIVGYNANMQYVTWTKPNRANAYSFDQYCNSGWINSTSIKYIRIVGWTGYEDKARFYQVDDSHLETLADVSSNPDAFIDGVSAGTNGFDSADLSKVTTDYISVTPGETLMFQAAKTRYVYFYDEDHKYIVTYGGGYTDYGSCEVPAQAAYVRYSISNNLDKETETAVLYRVKNSQVKDYEGTISWNLNDSSEDKFVLSDVLSDKNYYVKKYVSNSIDKLNYVQTYAHKNEIVVNDDKGITISDETKEGLESGKAFKYEIVVKYHNRELVLATCEFNTDNKIYLLQTPEDLKYIQYDCYATFIALNDIEEDSVYAPVNGTFGGVLDFQGHSLTLNYQSNYFIYYITPKGVVKNINVIYNESIDRGFVCENYGTIKDFVYTVDMAEGDNVLQSMIYRNRTNGKVSNFTVKLCGDVTVYNDKNTRASAILMRENYGYITDGYIYNTVKGGHVNIMYAYSEYNSNNGVLTASNSSSGVIKNIYSDIDLYCGYDSGDSKSSTGVISGSNAGRVSNIVGVGTRYHVLFDGENNQITDLGVSNFDDPLFGFRSGAMTNADGSADTALNYRYENVYLMDKYNTKYDPRFTYSKTFDLSNLYDPSWYSGNIQSDNQFNVQDYVEQGFYPLITRTEGGLVSGQTLNPLPTLAVHEAPTALDSVVESETDSYVDVIMKFSNPSGATITNVAVEGVESKILEQYDADGVYCVKVRLNNPTMYVTGYTAKSFTYRQVSTIATVNCNVEIDASFYKSIDSLDDWADWLGRQGKNRHLNYNYRLTNNLDFSSVTDPSTYFNKYYVNATFTGTLDGGKYDRDGNLEGRYVIQEIHLGDSNIGYHGILLQYVYYGTVKNLDFRNIDWNKTESNSAIYLGLIQHADYSVFDNIHIRNIELTAKSYEAPLLAYASNCTIQNCSVNDAKLRNISGAYHTVIGGLVSTGATMEIRNCYVAGLDMATDNVDLTQTIGLGGIIGNGYSGTRIEDCYVIGQIKSTSYVGGIGGIGDYIIDRCYSDVYIETDGDYNGGISGTTSMSAVVQNSFSVGNFVYAISNPRYTNRIIGVQSYWWLNNNYGYEYQTFNNQVGDDKNITSVLGYRDLTSEKTYTDTVKFNDTYDYSQLDDGILPKLKSTTGELLPYQNDRYLTAGELSADVISSTYDGSTYFNTDVRVTHQGYEIDEIMIEGMQIMDGYPLKKDTGVDSTSYYTIKSTNTSAYDVYRMRVKVHLKSDPTQTRVLTVSVDYHYPVYWVIHNADEWQDIMGEHGNTNENIKISGTIDFTGISKPVTGVVVNRLEGDTLSGTDNVFKNLTITDGANPSLVSVVYSQLSDLTFNNVNIEVDTLLTKSAGIINILQGNGSNLKFSNCHISTSGNDQINVGSSIKLGMICNAGGAIEDCTIENISIKAKSNNAAYREIITGGLVGEATNSVFNVDAHNIYINVDHGSNVGGILGRAYKKNNEMMYLNNLTLDNGNLEDDNKCHIAGAEFVGGLVGRSISMAMYDSHVEDTEVIANYTADDTAYNDGRYVGGLIGYTDVLIGNDKYTGYNAENVYVEGDNVVGILAGRSVNVTGIKVRNSQVKGHTNVGGIAGAGDGNITYSQTENTTIRANTAAGGIIGSGYTVQNSNVIKADIQAKYYAGGIEGANASVSRDTGKCTRRSDYTANVGVIDSKIEATSGYAGGIIGYSYSNNSTAMYRLFVKGSTITAGSEGYAGGIAGEMDAGNFYLCSVDNKTTVTSAGDYAGGIAGRVTWLENDYTSRLYQGYNSAAVTGKNYVGGIFGSFENKMTNVSMVPYLYGLVNLGQVTGTGDSVYAVGHVVGGDVGLTGTNVYGGLASYNEVKVNNAKVSETTLSNYTDSDKWKLMSSDQLTDYNVLVNSLAKGGLAFSGSSFNNFVTTAVKLENFAVSYTGLTDGSYNTASARYTFNLAGIKLNDGKYGLKVTQANGTITYGEQEITISGGKVDNVKIKYGNCTSTLNAVFTIYDLDSGKDYCQATVYNIQPVFGTHEMIVSGSVANTGSGYGYNDQLDKAITMTIGDSDGYTWRWYRVYSGNGYGRNIQEVTNLASADGKSLTTNVAGVYYAQSTSGNQRTQLFTYETYVYMPLLSTGTLMNMPFQNGYDYNNYTSLYNGDMNYVNAIPFTMATKLAAINDQEEEEVTIPTYSVYASSADSVNVELDNTVEMTVDNPKYSITVKTGETTKTYDVNGRVMSFQYDFNEDLEITVTSLSKPDVKTTSTHQATALRQSLSQYGDNYYYLTDDGVQVNSNRVEGQFIHIYKDKGIKMEDGVPTLWQLDSNVVDGDTISNCTILDSSIPLFEGTANGASVQYFKTFMYNATENTMSQGMIYDINGKHLGFDGGTVRTGNGLILDYITSDVTEGGEGVTKEQVVTCYLKSDGTLENIESFTAPNEFNNNSIVELSNNLDSTKKYAMVRYGYSNKVIVFDYTTGEVVSSYSNADASTFSLTSLAVFAKSYFNDFVDFLNYSTVGESKPLTVDELEGELMKIPDSDMRSIYALVGEFAVSTGDKTEAVDDGIKPSDEDGAGVGDSGSTSDKADNTVGDAVSRNYVPVYNAETQTYDIYTAEEIMDSESQLPMSENEKVAKAADDGFTLSVNSAIIDQKGKIVKSNWTRIILVMAIISSIVALWFTLRRKLRETDK